jgi:hypothetical protein
MTYVKPSIDVSDSIHFHSINTSVSVGNGGDGYSYGNIINKPYSYIDQSNSAGSTNTVDGHKVHSSIDADTHAHQSNTATVNQDAYIMAGIGGNGGNDNMVLNSGNVEVQLDSHLHI